MKRTLERDMYLTDAETRKLKRTCEDLALADIQKGRSTAPKLWIVVDMALGTGLRVSELAATRIEDIDWTNNALQVQRRKKRQEQAKVSYVPLPSKLAEHLKHYIGDRTTGPIVLGGGNEPLGPRGWQQAWLRACEKAGVRRLSIHKARHTLATILYKSTHDLRLVQDQLGHENPATTAIYASVTFEDRAAGIEKAEQATS